MAHPAPAPDRQRLCLCIRTDQRRGGRRKLLANLDGEALADPRPVRFPPGRRLKILGQERRRDRACRRASSSRSNRPASTSSRPASTGCSRCSRRPGSRAADIDEYNLQARTEYEDVRDFIIAHYKVTRRSGDPFWDHVRTMDVPDSLERAVRAVPLVGPLLQARRAGAVRRGKLGPGAARAGVRDARRSGHPVRLRRGPGRVPGRHCRGDRGRRRSKMPDHGEFVRRLPPSSDAAPGGNRLPQPPHVSFALRYERGETAA